MSCYIPNKTVPVLGEEERNAHPKVGDLEVSF